MLNRIIQFSLEHRWLVLTLTGLVAVFGAYSLMRLPIDAVPDVSSKIVQITTLYPALSTTEIETQVSFPIETALAGIPGLTGTRSLSRNGFSQVEAVFEDQVEIHLARQQILERLAGAREDLPPDAQPRLGPDTTGLGEIYVYIIDYRHPGGKGWPGAAGEPGWQPGGAYLTPEGERLEAPFEQAAYLRTVQDWQVAPQLRTVQGVAGIDSIGGYEKQYLVQPDPGRLVAFGITLPEVIESLERNNASIGAGYVEQQGEALIVRSEGRVRGAADIGHILIHAHDGTPVRLRDVATIGIGRELRTGSASENGREAVVGTVLMLRGANSRTVSTAVAQRVAELTPSLPPDIWIRPVLVRTDLVHRTIDTVRENLLLGALLVIVVLLLLLGNIRAALITATAIPLSILLTAIGMRQAGLSGNLMSLGAIDFGLVVDGAVIIVENCLRRLAERQRQLGRVLDLQERLAVVGAASREVRSATAFGETIIIMVYLPILALTGVEGKMFHPMALTVIFALTAAFVLSLTLIPALVAIVLRGRVKERENPLMQSLRRLYAPCLDLALRWRWPVAGVSGALFAGSLLLFTTLGQEFAPRLDEGNLSLQSVRIPSISLAQSQNLQFQVERAVSKLPEVELMYSKTGTAEVAFDPMPVNFSDAYIILKPRREWPDPRLTKEGLIRKIEAVVTPVPGNLYEFSQPIELRMNELVSGVRGDLAVKVFGDDFKRMQPSAQAVMGIIQTVPGAADVRVAQDQGYPVLSVSIDRDAAARVGLNIADIQEVLAIAVGGRETGVVFENDRRFPIIVRLSDTLRADLETIRQLPITLPPAPPDVAGPSSDSPGTAGATLRGAVPLGAVAKIEVVYGPNQVNRENGKRRITVQANVRGRDLGSFVAEVRRRVEAEVKPEAGVWLEWGGQYQNLLAARERLMLVVPACFLLILLCLYATFGSARDAVMVFTGVPLALTGGIAALWLRGIPFSISAAVGFIALSGVAVLNGLVLVTTINTLHLEGRDLAGAIREGALIRLRPVLMTALVAALGFVPMALASGAGAEVQRPLATVVIGGILSSTLLTLVVLPALYRIWHGREAGQPGTIKIDGQD